MILAAGRHCSHWSAAGRAARTGVNISRASTREYGTSLAACCASWTTRRPLLAGCRPRATLTARAASTAPGLANTPWTGSPQETEALRRLQERVQAQALPYTPPAEVQQWFLRDRSFDVDEAADKLRTMARWRHQARPELLQCQDVAAELQTGKALVHDRLDVFGRPVVVVLARHHLKVREQQAAEQRVLEDSQKLGVYIIEQALARLEPGQDSILGIFDMQGFTWANADFAYVEFLVDLFFSYYPRRLSQVLVVDAPWLFRPAWGAVRPMLRKYAALVSFVSRRQLAEEYFTPDTLPGCLRI